MANLKDLKVRINSVKSTQKITKAMKMVSAAKLRRARESAEAAVPYAERMERMLMTLANNISKESAPALLAGNGKDNHHLLVVITSDRGLCGGLNSALIKQVRSKISQLTSEGKDVSLFCIGKKGIDSLIGSYRSIMVQRIEGISKKRRIEFEDAATQARLITELYEKGEFDICTIFYNHFKSVIDQEVTVQQLIPLDITSNENEADSIDTVQASYEYEPSEDAILDELLPRNLAIQVYRSFLDNSASEHGARMTAMDSATRNAGDMIKGLTLVYNRTRQAAITKELIEIISGAEAI